MGWLDEPHVLSLSLPSPLYHSPLVLTMCMQLLINAGACPCVVGLVSWYTNAAVPLLCFAAVPSASWVVRAMAACMGLGAAWRSSVLTAIWCAWIKPIPVSWAWEVRICAAKPTECWVSKGLFQAFLHALCASVSKRSAWRVQNIGHAATSAAGMTLSVLSWC